MTSKNTTSKDVENNEGVEAEASVPQQNSGVKVTVLKGVGEDGKDAVVVSDGEESTVVEKLKKMIRNPAVIAGLSSFATLVVLSLIGGIAAKKGRAYDAAHPEDYEAGMKLAKQYDDEANGASENN